MSTEDWPKGPSRPGPCLRQGQQQKPMENDEKYMSRVPFSLNVSLNSSYLLLSSFLSQYAFAFDDSHLNVDNNNYPLSKAHMNPCYYHKTMWKHCRWGKKVLQLLANLWLLLATSPLTTSGTALWHQVHCHGMAYACLSPLSYPPKQ